MSESVELLHGWYSLHDFRHFDAEAYRQSSEEERARFLNAIMGFWEQNEKIDAAKEGSFGVYSIIGHKADLLFLTLRPELSSLLKQEREIAAWPLSQTLVPNYSYFGVVELSNYVVSADQRAQHEEMIQRRLRPSLPHKKSLCFYPMNKKREGQDNWYALPMEERQRMMRSHGKTGRKHADIVTQMISGSIGLDDYEWGVTLFADDPLAFKTVVTEMRFDEVSARYAEFGVFLVGNRLKREELLAWFQSHSKA